MTSKVIILCGLVALVSAGTLRPSDRKQWKAAQESQGSFEIRPETLSKSSQSNEKEIDETTTIKSARLATRTYFGYGDSKPIKEESMEIPKEQMRHTQIYESQPTVQWYHRQPTFSWEYKNSDNNDDGSISYKSVTVTEPEKAEEQQQEDEQQSKQENMSIEEKKAESAAEAAALQRAQYESNERAFHHHHHHHYENNYRQQEVIEQAQYKSEQATTTEEIQDTKKSDAEEEIQQVEAEKTAEFKTEIKPIVVLEQQTTNPITKSYTQYAQDDQSKEEKWAPVNYEFRYEVNDKETGDIKHHEEKAIAGKITGEYALLDADGMTRIVKYTADDENGFLADVTREERTGKIIAAAYEPKWWNLHTTYGD